MRIKYCLTCSEGTQMPSDHCTKCGQPFSTKCSAEERHAVHIFREGLYEHIDAKPIYIKSKKQLRQETESRGLTSHYIH